MGTRSLLSVSSTKRQESLEQLLQESIFTTPGRSTTNNATAADAGHTIQSAPIFEETPILAHPSPQLLAASVAWLKDMTIVKAFIILYCLSIVAWGGMIFLLLCNAAPAMCHPSCSHVNSARRKWIEIDSQILNALFCAPAFGLAPQRFLDAWRLLQASFGGRKKIGPLQHLAARRRNWFRLPGSQNLPLHVGPPEVKEWLLVSPNMLAVVPYPARCIPEAPSSGKRAWPTEFWKLATVIVLELMNTVFQAILSGFMWGYNRYTRPSWSVPFFLCSAFVTSIAANVLEHLECKKVKRMEIDIDLDNSAVKGVQRV